MPVSNADNDQDKAPTGVEEGGTPSCPGIDLSRIGNDLTSTMPDIQEHAIVEDDNDQNMSNISAGQQDSGGPVDRNGKSFDISIHKADEHGNPLLSKRGKLMMKPGRKTGNDSAPQKPATKSYVPDIAGERANAAAVQQARATGRVTANMIIQIGIVAGGDEWQPIVNNEIGLDEKSLLEGAFADYFEATGKTDLPPGLSLALAIGSYALPRFTMPKTQSRLSKLKNGIKKWWINRKLKKHGMKAEPINKEVESND